MPGLIRRAGHGTGSGTHKEPWNQEPSTRWPIEKKSGDTGAPLPFRRPGHQSLRRPSSKAKARGDRDRALATGRKHEKESASPRQDLARATSDPGKEPGGQPLQDRLRHAIRWVDDEAQPATAAMPGPPQPPHQPVNPPSSMPFAPADRILPATQQGLFPARKMPPGSG
jgi:hypothetical protein